MVSALTCSASLAATINYSEAVSGDLLDGPLPLIDRTVTWATPQFQLGVGQNTFSGSAQISSDGCCRYILDTDSIRFTLPTGTKLSNITFMPTNVVDTNNLFFGNLLARFAPTSTANAYTWTSSFSYTDRIVPDMPQSILSYDLPLMPAPPGSFYGIHQTSAPPLPGGTTTFDYTYTLTVEALLPPPTQTIYLDFAEGLIPVPPASLSWWANDVGVYTKPDAGLSSADINAVVGKVQYLFRDFRVDITSAEPMGEHSTIFVGGTASDIGAPFSDRLGAGVLGIAEYLDFDNANKTDIAHVFSSSIRGSGTPSYLDALALTIAHEAGHILGLQHVDVTGELLYSNNAGYGPGISDTTAPLVFPWGAGCQNSYQELGRNVGFTDGGLPAPEAPCEYLGRFYGRGNSLIESLFLYGATLAVVYSEDVGPTMFSLGDLSSANGFAFNLLMRPGLSYAIFGSSIPNGPIDTITSPFGLDFITQFSSIQDLDPSSFLASFSVGSSSLNLYRFRSNGPPISLGFVTTELDLAVPEPATGALVLSGLLGVATHLRRRMAHGKRCQSANSDV